MLLYALNLGFFILGFAIYPVAYGVGFTLQALPIVTWISNFKQQTIVGGQYFNVPKPTEFWQDLLDSNRPGITHKHSVSAKEERPIVSAY